MSWLRYEGNVFPSHSSDALKSLGESLIWAPMCDSSRLLTTRAAEKKPSTLALLSTCRTVSQSHMVVVVVAIVKMCKTDFTKLMASKWLLTEERKKKS